MEKIASFDDSTIDHNHAEVSSPRSCVITWGDDEVRPTGPGGDGAVPPGAALGDVHLGVGGVQQRVGGGVAPARGDPDRDPDRDLRGTDLERLGHQLVESGSQRGDFPAIEPGTHEHELVAAESTEPVLFSDRPASARRHLHQQFVPDVVAESVVHRLEAVEVEEQDRERTPSGSGGRQLLLDEPNGRPAVGESRQHVAFGQTGEVVGQQLAGGDVDVEEHDAGAVGDRGEGGLEQEPSVLGRGWARVLEIELLPLTLEDLP